MKVRLSAVLLAGIGAGIAASTSVANAAIPAATDSCPAPQVSQPFLSMKDSNWYELAPGQTPDSFAGTGWTLTGGARIVTTTLADGSTGQVLDLPAGATATSPLFCLATDFPTAKAMVRSVSGAPGLTFAVSYPDHPQTTKTANVPSNNNWAVSTPLKLNPAKSTNWQQAQITFTANGKGGGEYQIYNVYIDPRLC